MKNINDQPHFQVGDRVSVERWDRYSPNRKIKSPGKVLAVEPTVFGEGWRYKVRGRSGRIVWGDQVWFTPWQNEELKLS